MTSGPLFASARERRLWLWALAVLGGIWVTLPFASILAERVGESDLIVVGFALALVLTVATVLTQGLKVRPGGLELGVALGVGTVLMLVFLRTAMPERSHLMEYGVLAVLVLEALLERRSNDRRVPVPALLAVAVVSVLGLLDEGIQALIPSSVFDPLDLVFNTSAAVMAVVGVQGIRWARERQERSTR